MIIHSLKIKKLYGYKDYFLDFDRDVTFLVGINGSGKTTIIKIIKALLENDNEFFKNFKYESIELAFQINGTRQNIKKEFKKSKDIERIFSDKFEYIKVERKDEEDLLKILGKGKEIKTEEELTRFLFKNLSPLEEINNKLKELIIEKLSVADEILKQNYLYIESILEFFVKKGNLFEDSELEKLFLTDLELLKRSLYEESEFENNKIKLQNLLGIISQEIENKMKKNDAESLRTLLNELFTPITTLSENMRNLDKEKIFKEIRLDIIIKHLNEFYKETYKEVYFDTEDNKIKIIDYLDRARKKSEVFESFYRLSSGEKNILIFLVNVLFDKNKKLYLMDEPENSLHMEWQKQLSKFIKENAKEKQFIIATHSPDITESFVGENFIFLNPYEEKGR